MVIVLTGSKRYHVSNHSFCLAIRYRAEEGTQQVFWTLLQTFPQEATPMSIRVVCPSCDKVYNLEDSMRGKKVLCRSCKEPIAIPSASRKEEPEDDRRSRDDRIKESPR